MIIRKLTKEDFKDYQLIRLELLKKHPENFGSSFEEESQFPTKVWIERLSKQTVTTFGAFKDNKIIGLCVIVKNPRLKLKHVASLHSMYVKPQYRKQNIATRLINQAIEKLTSEGVEMLNLSVVTTNNQAIKLYKSLGFIQYGIEPKTIKYNDNYHDLMLLSKQL